MREILKQILLRLDQLYLSEVYFRFKLFFNYFVLKRKKKQIHDTIISLTSYPEKYNVLYLTLLSLFSQSVKPKKIILWLYYKDYSKLPRKILDLVNKNFQIKKTYKNLKNYQKLIPCYKNFKKYKIVTADDDMYYPTDWLKYLIDKSSKNKNIVYGHRGHLINYKNKKIFPYSTWKDNIYLKKFSKMILLTGVGGIIYPKYFLNKNIINEKIFLKICEPDDIWFYYMCRIKNLKFGLVNKYIRLYGWRYHGNKLSDKLYLNYNDIAIKNMQKKYKLKFFKI
jgi:hypothetical protein